MSECIYGWKRPANGGVIVAYLEGEDGARERVVVYDVDRDGKNDDRLVGEAIQRARRRLHERTAFRACAFCGASMRGAKVCAGCGA